MKQVTLPGGERVGALGLGTWKMASAAADRAEEIATIRLALDRGAALIDTAEMYGEGKAEALIGEAVAGRRDDAFIVSKVYPHNASKAGAIAACERSLKRLRTDRIDLYLLHWRGAIPLAETLEGFMALKEAGKIRHYGVSNIDVSAMEELWRLPGGRAIATNQLYYNLARRGLEWDLLPWCREHGMSIMAYSPIDEGRLVRHRQLAALAADIGATASQLALAWLLRHDDVIVIPKTSRRERLQENLGALDLRLRQDTLMELDRLFPPPSDATPLEMT
jgi:aldehyde reductase